MVRDRKDSRLTSDWRGSVTRNTSVSAPAFYEYAHFSIERNGDKNNVRMTRGSSCVLCKARASRNQKGKTRDYQGCDHRVRCTLSLRDHHSATGGTILTISGHVSASLTNCCGEHLGLPINAKLAGMRCAEACSVSH